MLLSLNNRIITILKIVIITAEICFCAQSASAESTAPVNLPTSLKEAYKEAFLMGSAVNHAIVSGRDKSSGYCHSSV